MGKLRMASLTVRVEISKFVYRLLCVVWLSSAYRPLHCRMVTIYSKKGMGGGMKLLRHTHKLFNDNPRKSML